MNILIISYAFPPIKTMASYRNYLIAKGLKETGNNITILSTRNKEYFPQQSENLEGLTVHYLPTFDYRTFNKSEKVSGTSETGNALKRFIRRIKNSFPFNLLFGLGGVLFIVSGVLKAYRLARKQKFDLLISHSPPISNQIMAKWVKKTNPNIKWIVDFHHLYIDPERKNVVFEGFQRIWIKRLLKKADYLITVSEGLLKGFEYLNLRNEVIELGFDHDSLSNNKNLKKKAESFTLSYCGSLYDEQQINILLKALVNLNEKKAVNIKDFKFIYAGANYNKWLSKVQSFLDTNNVQLQNLGVISREKCIEIIKASHINLLLSWNTNSIKTIIPGKYYDYISAQKPVLLIINGIEDLGWQKRFSELNPGLLCYERDETKELEDFLLSEYLNWKNNFPSKIVYNEIALKKHSIQNQTKKLELIIQEIT